MTAQALAEFETLKLELEDGIALLTLNRPEKLNAFNPLMNRELIAAFDLTDATDDVRAVIVTGAGRGFCAGADLGGGGSTFDFDSRSADPLGQRTESGVYRDGGGLVSLRIYE
ncbi:MAG: enoyl-CoA hydratase-related protein, partial [Phenylobacterium sp.]